MSNTITNKGLTYKSYNGRGAILHRGVTRALIVASDGTLWAAYRDGHSEEWIVIDKSDDNGFSWKEMYRGDFTSNFSRVGLSTLNQNGPYIDLAYYEDVNMFSMVHAMWDTSRGEFGAEIWVFDYDEEADVLTRVTEPTRVPTNNVYYWDQDLMAMRVAYNELSLFAITASFNDLKAESYRITDLDTAEHSGTLDGDYFPVFDAIASTGGWVDTTIVFDNGGNYKIHWSKYTHNTGIWNASVEVYATAAVQDIYCLNIVRDGWGNLLIGWGESSETDTDSNVKYSISKDDGGNWDAAITIDKTSGHSTFIDAPTGEKDVRLDVLPGLTGFILTYARFVEGVAKTFVRTLISADGVSYTLGDEAEIATQTALASEDVAGARFFRPTGTRLLDIEDPGAIRVAYQIGQGNSTQQADTIPIKIGQELLRESAYPELLESETGTYETDVATELQTLVTMSIYAGPNENADYYDLGFTGTITDRYIGAIHRLGVSCRLLEYAPDQLAEMDDRTAYDAPIETVKKVVVSTETYDLPMVSQDDNFTDYIERDIRKVHLPPDFHLNRTFLLNRGNFIKRTVWTITFDGNEYELTQVVPHFLDDQICYYSANAYVIGPSRDPFSRTILPSET